MKRAWTDVTKVAQPAPAGLVKLAVNGDKVRPIFEPHFEIISDVYGIRAILVHRPLTTLQTIRVLKLFCERFANDPELCRRWNLQSVFCEREWASEQKKRSPMLRPNGVRLAFCEMEAS